MSLSANWELQKAMHAALVGDTTLATLVAGRIYDRPPDDVAYPFITLGDTDVAVAGDGEDAAHMLVLVIWSRAKGRREAKEIMSCIYEALHEAPLTLVGHVLVNMRFEQASLKYASDADALRGKIRFRAFTEANI